MLRVAIGQVELDTFEALLVECTWENNTGLELVFPDEMCTAKGLATPLEEPVGCTDSEHPP